MATIVKDLGAVSAYAYAVEQGYTGTEEEFAELMASYATVAESAAASATAAAGSALTASTKASEAAASVNTAQTAATTATTKAGEAATSATNAANSANTANTKAGEAAQSATDAAGSATAASGSASDANAAKLAAQSAQTAAETAQGKAEEAQTAAEAAQTAAEEAAETAQETLESYAKVDGSYETMTVGNAEQLVATVGVDDSTPYNFRTSGGSVDIGDRETVDAVVGGTVAWNQLGPNNYSQDTYGTKPLVSGTRIVKDHVYLMGVKRNPTLSYFFLAVYGRENDENRISFRIQKRYLANTDPVIFFTIKKAIIGGVSNGSVRNENGNVWLYASNTAAEGETFGLSDLQITDLTQMFGSTIADYIYSLEQATEGAGGAWFKKLFPKDYYEYNAGELLSVNTSQHKMVGFNAYNPETGTAHVVGGNQYQITGAYTALSLDGETVTPDASGYFTPSANGTLTVTGGNSSTTCVHLVWSGYRDGEYEPYQEWVYPLDSSLTLRGIPKLDASGNLYYDGDTYEADGTVTRRYGIVDLGTLNWSYQATATLIRPRFAARIVPVANNNQYWCNNIMLSTGKYSKGNSIGQHDVDMEYGIASSSDGSSSSIYLTDSGYTDAATFKAAMSGVYLVYELATPTTETAEPYTQIQSVDDFGTEEYTDAAYEAGARDVAIPVGHNTFYPANLRDKLQHLPDLASADGYYMIQQTDSEMGLVLFRIPQASGLADGTYTLKATVVSGTPTYTWVAESESEE